MAVATIRGIPVYEALISGLDLRHEENFVSR